MKSITTPKTKAEKIEHDAGMLSLYFLSEVEKVLDERKLTKKALAKKVGTSPSYITQLFRGHKLLSMEMISKIQYALKIKFTVKAEQLKQQ